MSKKQDFGLRCPHCGKPCGFATQIEEWDQMYGGDVAIDVEGGSWAMINIVCQNCDKHAWMVDLSAAESEKIIKISKGVLKGKKLVLPSAVPNKKRRKN
jgi:hypothetical protein